MASLRHPPVGPIATAVGADVAGPPAAAEVYALDQLHRLLWRRGDAAAQARSRIRLRAAAASAATLAWTPEARAAAALWALAASPQGALALRAWCTLVARAREALQPATALAPPRPYAQFAREPTTSGPDVVVLRFCSAWGGSPVYVPQAELTSLVWGAPGGVDPLQQLGALWPHLPAHVMPGAMASQLASRLRAASWRPQLPAHARASLLWWAPRLEAWAAREAAYAFDAASSHRRSTRSRSAGPALGRVDNRARPPAGVVERPATQDAASHGSPASASFGPAGALVDPSTAAAVPPAPAPDPVPDLTPVPDPASDPALEPTPAPPPKPAPAPASKAVPAPVPAPVSAPGSARAPGSHPPVPAGTRRSPPGPGSDAGPKPPSPRRPATNSAAGWVRGGAQTPPPDRATARATPLGHAARTRPRDASEGQLAPGPVEGRAPRPHPGPPPAALSGEWQVVPRRRAVAAGSATQSQATRPVGPDPVPPAPAAADPEKIVAPPGSRACAGGEPDIDWAALTRTLAGGAADGAALAAARTRGAGATFDGAAVAVWMGAWAEALRPERAAVDSFERARADGARSGRAAALEDVLAAWVRGAPSGASAGARARQCMGALPADGQAPAWAIVGWLGAKEARQLCRERAEDLLSHPPAARREPGTAALASLAFTALAQDGPRASAALSAAQAQDGAWAPWLEVEAVLLPYAAALSAMSTPPAGAVRAWAEACARWDGLDCAALMRIGDDATLLAALTEALAQRPVAPCEATSTALLRTLSVRSEAKGGRRAEARPALRAAAGALLRRRPEAAAGLDYARRATYLVLASAKGEGGHAAVRVACTAVLAALAAAEVSLPWGHVGALLCEGGDATALAQATVTLCRQKRVPPGAVAMGVQCLSALSHALEDVERPLPDALWSTLHAAMALLLHPFDPAWREASHAQWLAADLWLVPLMVRGQTLLALAAYTLSLAWVVQQEAGGAAAAKQRWTRPTAEAALRRALAASTPHARERFISQLADNLQRQLLPQLDPAALALLDEEALQPFFAATLQPFLAATLQPFFASTLQPEVGPAAPRTKQRAHPSPEAQQAPREPTQSFAAHLAEAPASVRLAYTTLARLTTESTDLLAAAWRRPATADAVTLGQVERFLSSVAERHKTHPWGGNEPALAKLQELVVRRGSLRGLLDTVVASRLAKARSMPPASGDAHRIGWLPAVRLSCRSAPAEARAERAQSWCHELGVTTAGETPATLARHPGVHRELGWLTQAALYTCLVEGVDAAARSACTTQLVASALACPPRAGLWPTVQLVRALRIANAVGDRAEGGTEAVLAACLAYVAHAAARARAEAPASHDGGADAVLTVLDALWAVRHDPRVPADLLHAFAGRIGAWLRAPARARASEAVYAQLAEEMVAGQVDGHAPQQDVIDRMALFAELGLAEPAAPRAPAARGRTRALARALREDAWAHLHGDDALDADEALATAVGGREENLDGDPCAILPNPDDGVLEVQLCDPAVRERLKQAASTAASPALGAAIHARLAAFSRLTDVT